MIEYIQAYWPWLLVVWLLVGIIVSILIVYQKGFLTVASLMFSIFFILPFWPIVLLDLINYGEIIWTKKGMKHKIIGMANISIIDIGRKVWYKKPYNRGKKWKLSILSINITQK